MKGKYYLWYVLLIAAVIACNSQQVDTREFAGEKFKANIRITDARTPEEERVGFKVPDGFEINLFASEPDIGKPINFAFDAKGRMWVTQSFEYPFPSVPGKGKDRLTILEDIDKDGKADKFTVFSDTLNIPIGILPLDDGALTYSIPDIYKYTDSNNDGRMDGQKKLFGPFRINDTHGMINNFVRGYDGWIHSCHGYVNRDTIAGTDGDSIAMVSGNTFRFKPDGSRVENTTYGRINPFGLVYDELGYLYSTDCHTSPLYQLIGGADYTQWGKEEGMGFAPDMTPLSDEATALAGIGYYGDILFPKLYRSNFYVGDVVRSRVYRYSHTFKGSTPVGKREEDFVLSDDPWFRPVDVKLGPDGALYVADFYNSIIGHYEVPLDHPGRDRTRGRIWRITYKGKTNPVPDLTSATVDELLKALNLENISARMLAADQMADRVAQTAVPGITSALHEENIDPRKYIHLLWVLQRLNALQPAALKSAVNNSDPLIRLHAMRILAEKKPDESFFPLVLQGLQDPDPHVKRSAVELLAKYPSMHSLKEALHVRDDIPDYETHLLYATRLSLRNILRRDSILESAASVTWSEHDAAAISDVLMGVPSQQAGIFLYRYVTKFQPAAGRAASIYRHIARFAPYSLLDSTVTIAMRSTHADTINLLVFKSIQEGISQRGQKENPVLVKWGKALAEKVLSSYPYKKEASLETIKLQTFAAGVAGKYKLKTVSAPLETFLKNLSTEDLMLNGLEISDELVDLKAAAIRSLIMIDQGRGLRVALRILNDNSSDAYFRNITGRVLGEFPGDVVNQVLKGVKNAPPELQSNIALTLASTTSGKEILFAKVKNREMFARTLLQPKIQERILLNISPAQEKIFRQLTAGIDPVDKTRQDEIYKRVLEFEKAMTIHPPSLDSGRIVFVQNCSPCHSIAEKGGNIGPNLDGVSQWGPKALAEKILDPNRNISENFRTYTISTKDGKTRSGLYRRDEGATVVFADLSGKEFSIPKTNIAIQTSSKLTLMPDNFREKLSQKEFNQLIHFLIDPKGWKSKN